MTDKDPRPAEVQARPTATMTAVAMGRYATVCATEGFISTYPPAKGAYDELRVDPASRSHAIARSWIAASSDPHVVKEAEEGKILLRVFFHPHGNKIVLLLSGYEKAEHTSKAYQNTQIEEARRLLSHWKEREKARG